jgi:adenylate kinase
MRVNLVLIGPPGSGKGTQAVRLSRRFHIPHISTGDILRQAVRDGTPLGRQVAEIIARGSLVSDALVGELVRERLATPDTSRGFILDGFPRTIAQAATLEALLPGERVLVALIAAPDEAIVRRLSSRRVCESCGLAQSVAGTAERQEETCPYCGGSLVRREDDEEATVRHRLATYAAFAEPIIAHYRSTSGFFAVDGLQPPDAVTAALVAGVEARRGG